MKRLLVFFVVLFTVFFSYTIIAQEMGALRKGVAMSFPEKVQTPLGPPLAAGTYTVGTGGNFPTIDSAFKKLSADGVAGAVTLELINTLYTAPTDSFGFKLVGPIPGAGPSSRVTIKPAANKNVTIEGNGIGVLYFLKTSYLTLDGVNITGATTLTVHNLVITSYQFNDAICFIGNCDNNVVQNTIALTEDITGVNSGVTFWPEDNVIGTPDSNLIQNNFIKKATFGFYVGANQFQTNKAAGNIIRGNIIGSETDSLISCAGIQTERVQNTIIENNLVRNLKRKVLSFWEPDTWGINTWEGIGTIIRNNVIHNLSSNSDWGIQGILLSASSPGVDNMIYNNMIFNINSTSTHSNSRIAGIQIYNQVNPKIYYNSVYLSGTGNGANPIGSAALIFPTGITNADVKNNIFVNTRDESPYCASAIYDYTASNLSSDYNDLYYDNTNTNNCMVRIGSTKYNTLPNWQATGKDLNSVSEMPNFIAPYLHINSAIPTYLEKGATPIAGITTDFDGQPRNATKPDIGADEFDGIVVPVELTSFTVSALGNEVTLNWTTATELNNYGFEIQRKTFGGEFATVAFVKGQGTTTQQNQYSFADKNLDEGKYFYRLKQMDYGGQYSYSQTVEVDVRMLSKYSLEQNYPNPFNPTTTIGYVLQEKSNAKLTMLNSLGEEIAVLVNDEQDKGYHKVEFDATKLTSGVYFYQLRAGRFIETKKMLLLR